jgi:hypothetical protein
MNKRHSRTYCGVLPVWQGIVLITLFLICLWPAYSSARTWQDDSATVYEILALNGYTKYEDLPLGWKNIDESDSNMITRFIDSSNGRIVSLDFYGDVDNLPFLPVLPEAIGRLDSLKRLNISQIGITSFPESLWTLKSLTTLDVSENDIDSIPSGIGNLVNLDTLKIGYSGSYSHDLTKIPESIGNLRELRVLWMHGLGLSRLPESIGNLQALEELDISYQYNREGHFLDTIPESISRCKNLRVFYAHRNRIRSLPNDIGDLTNLQELALFENRIETLPESIVKLQNLNYMNIRKNRICSFSESIKAWADQYDPDWNGHQYCESFAKPYVPRNSNKQSLSFTSAAGQFVYSIDGRRIRIEKLTSRNNGYSKGIYIIVSKTGIVHRSFLETID